MTLPRPPKVLNDRREKAKPGEPVDLWLYSPFPKPGWVARKAGDALRAEHPGTAIEIENELFEVLLMEEIAGADHLVRYGLKRWDPQHVVRQRVVYAPETQAQEAGDYRDEKRTRELRTSLLWLFPLAGLAPGGLQRAWGKKTGLPMVLISAGSAAFFLALAFALRQLPAHYPALRFLLYYLVFDSIVRLLWMAGSGKPQGTVIVAAPYRFWKLLALPKPLAHQQPEWLKSVFEDDEVIRRPAARRLIIRSMLFDDALVGPRPVRFEGVAYRPLRWHKEGKGLGRRWVYELEALDSDRPGRCREYTHPRTPERQALVEAYTRRLDLAHSFAFIWGLYPRKDQLRLEILYQFGAAKFTALSAAVFLVCAALEILLTFRLRHTPDVLIGPVYLGLESLYRLVRARVQGQPAGSLVGYALRLLIRPPI